MINNDIPTDKTGSNMVGGHFEGDFFFGTDDYAVQAYCIVEQMRGCMEPLDYRDAFAHDQHLTSYARLSIYG